jgi:hypothetical protein
MVAPQTPTRLAWQCSDAYSEIVAERPDLEYQLPVVGRELEAKRIGAVAVQKPIVLRLAQVTGAGV